MKKRVFGKKFSRDTTSRRAMYRALIKAFVTNRKLTTTRVKAKVVVPILESLFNRGKSADVSSRHIIYSYTGNNRVISDEIIKIAAELKNTSGSFLKLVNLPARKGDNSPMARIEFIKNILEKKPEHLIGSKEAEKRLVNVENKEENKGKKLSLRSAIKKLSIPGKQIKK